MPKKLQWGGLGMYLPEQKALSENLNVPWREFFAKGKAEYAAMSETNKDPYVRAYTKAMAKYKAAMQDLLEAGGSKPSKSKKAVKPAAEPVDIEEEVLTGSHKRKHAETGFQLWYQHLRDSGATSQQTSSKGRQREASAMWAKLPSEEQAHWRSISRKRQDAIVAEQSERKKARAAPQFQFEWASRSFQVTVVPAGGGEPFQARARLKVNAEPAVALPSAAFLCCPLLLSPKDPAD